jgi:hypothetical protein
MAGPESYKAPEESQEIEKEINCRYPIQKKSFSNDCSQSN